MNAAQPENPRLLAFDEVCQKLSAIIYEQMGIVVTGKEDVPFLELHQDFDSLAFTELQLLLEEHYDFELKFDAHAQALPATVREFSQQVVQQYDRLHAINATT
jgi:acyl carrier protein